MGCVERCVVPRSKEGARLAELRAGWLTFLWVGHGFSQNRVQVIHDGNNGVGMLRS